MDEFITERNMGKCLCTEGRTIQRQLHHSAGVMIQERMLELTEKKHVGSSTDQRVSQAAQLSGSLQRSSYSLVMEKLVQQISFRDLLSLLSCLLPNIIESFFGFFWISLEVNWCTNKREKERSRSGGKRKIELSSLMYILKWQSFRDEYLDNNWKIHSREVKCSGIFWPPIYHSVDFSKRNLFLFVTLNISLIDFNAITSNVVFFFSLALLEGAPPISQINTDGDLLLLMNSWS